MIASPPDRRRSDELEALIREARTRQRKRWLGVAVAVALLAGAAIGIESILRGSGPNTARTIGGPSVAARNGKACGVRGVGVRILDQDGRTLYREPGRYTRPNAGFPTIRCSGSTIWAVWFNGVGMSQEAYLGARSLDSGRTWKLVFTEGMFGPKAPHELDAYLGVWTLRGPHDAYFTGSCPACDGGELQGTISLWVTKDGGRTFRMYKVPMLTGYEAIRIRVKGDAVTILAKRFIAGVRPARKTVTVHVA
jgi:hypothetical protein